MENGYVIQGLMEEELGRVERVRERGGGLAMLESEGSIYITSPKGSKGLDPIFCEIASVLTQYIGRRRY